MIRVETFSSFFATVEDAWLFRGDRYDDFVVAYFLAGSHLQTTLKTSIKEEQKLESVKFIAKHFCLRARKNVSDASFNEMKMMKSFINFLSCRLFILSCHVRFLHRRCFERQQSAEEKPREKIAHFIIVLFL